MPANLQFTRNHLQLFAVVGRDRCPMGGHASAFMQFTCGCLQKTCENRACLGAKNVQKTCKNRAMVFVLPLHYHIGIKYEGVVGLEELKIFEERLKGHNKMLEEHEHRINDHEKRIRHQETHEGVVDESVRNVCKRVDGLTKALWAVAMACGSAAIAFFLDLIK